MKRFGFLCGTFTVGVCIAFAHSEETFHHFKLSAGARLPTITSTDAGKLHHGRNLQLNSGYLANLFFGVIGNFEAAARVYGVTADPPLRLPLGRSFAANVMAGGAYLRRTIEFTQPTLARTFVFDPWWRYLCPGLVPVDLILGRVINNSQAPGGGLNMPLPRTRAKALSNRKYFTGVASNTNTTVVLEFVGNLL